MKDLLDRIKETWEIIQTGPENEILRNYTEEGRIFSIQYACELSLIYNNFLKIYIYIIHIIIYSAFIYT
jgi:hypothetical protein